MNTEMILTDLARVGMVVAKDIYSRYNQLLINKEMVINEQSIAKLKVYGIKEFSIQKYTKDDIDSKIEVKTHDNQVTQKEYDTLREESPYYYRVRNTKEFVKFSKSFDEALGRIEKNFNRLIDTGQEVNTDILLAEIDHILEASRNGIHVLDMLNCMRIYDDSTYVHSLNVALICNVIGGWVKLSDSDVRLLTLCGLLHDVGKLMIPKDIISKPDKLTADEYTIVKNHPSLGFELLKDKNIDLQIKKAVLMHHERYDGSGYPAGLLAKSITPFAKVVAIADVYDAMTSKRVYRDPICPFTVIEMFEKEGFHKYDPYYLLVFLDRMVQSYIHNWVLLSNNQRAEVIMINKLALSKPVVRTQNEDYIDLSHASDILIEAII